MNRLQMARVWLVGSILSFPASAFAQSYLWLNKPIQPQNPFFEPVTLQMRIAGHLISAIMGIAVGVFFSDRLKKFRRYIFLGAIALLLLCGAIFSTTIGDILAFVVGSIVAFRFLRDQKTKGQSKQAKPTTFGSAEWATLDHLQQNGLTGNKGFILGFFKTWEQPYPLRYAGDRHLLTIAPTRSGKGVAAIVPNLLTYEGSAIVIDPKGENARITAARRGQGDAAHGIPGMGQTVHVVDPWGITGLPDAWFNPMDWLQPDDEDINENAMMLADSIVTRRGSNDPFWDEEAKALLMGLLLYVALDEREQEDRTLGRLTMVEQAYGLMAGFGMQLWGIVQDLSQLERIYEKGWETFIGNSGVLQYFGSRDHKTAEYFSKLCGVTTIQKFSFTRAIARAVGWSSSTSSGGQGGGSSSSGTSSSVTNSESTTYDLVQRHLAFPDELMVLRDDKQLLMVENCNPIPGKKLVWYRQDQLKALGVNLQAALPDKTAA